MSLMETVETSPSSRKPLDGRQALAAVSRKRNLPKRSRFSPGANHSLCRHPRSLIFGTRERNRGRRGVGIIPAGCDPQHPDLQTGLCYQSCPAGMDGKGPVCWTTSKVSTPRGAGLIPKSCPSDHPDEAAGLCYQSCPDGYHGIGPVCWKGISSHARGVGVPPNGCDPAHPDMNAGLCYAACPAGQSGDGPVCWTNQPLSHPRGAGVVPTGCPADHPNLDAGLCYQTCQSGKGVGPVCWAMCQGKFAEACGAGCATNKVECGFAMRISEHRGHGFHGIMGSDFTASRAPVLGV